MSDEGKKVDATRDNPLDHSGGGDPMVGIRNDDPKGFRTRSDGKTRQAYRGRERG